MSERKLKWYYKNRLNELGYNTEGLDLHQLKELNEDHKRKTTTQKEPEIDEDVKDFYKAFEEPETPVVHKGKYPDGVSPLLYGKTTKSTKFVDLDGEEIKPKKKEDKRLWKL